LAGLGNQNAERDPRQAQTRAGARAHAADQAIRAAITGPISETPLKSFPGSPSTLGNAAAIWSSLIRPVAALAPLGSSRKCARPCDCQQISKVAPILVWLPVIRAG